MRLDGRLVPAAPLADATAPPWPGARLGAGVGGSGNETTRVLPTGVAPLAPPHRTGSQAQRRCPPRRHRRTACPPAPPLDALAGERRARGRASDVARASSSGAG
jgi:hypothetical protein